MNNQRGGILSKIFIIPAGVALMVGFFFLGYYVGKYQSRSVPDKTLPPLPEVGSEKLPRQEDFTFYKTLTEKENRTVSIDLKPKKGESSPAPAQDPGLGERSARAAPEKTIEIKVAGPRTEQPKPEKKLEISVEKPAEPKPGAPQKAEVKKEEPSAPSNIRYTIQIASYNERDMAEEEVKRMKKRGYAAFIVSSEVPDKGTWYRVRLGSFSNKGAAERLLNELRNKEGLSPFVTIE